MLIYDEQCNTEIDNLFPEGDRYWSIKELFNNLNCATCKINVNLNKSNFPKKVAKGEGGVMTPFH